MTEAPKKKPRCFLAADGKTFTMASGDWSDSYPIDRAPRLIKFYESLRDRKGGVYAANYQPKVDALRKLQRRIAGD